MSVINKIDKLIGEAKTPSTEMECQECGKLFKKKIGPRTMEVQCPKCKGYDTLPTSFFGRKK